jgi:hypothetical protein
MTPTAAQFEEAHRIIYQVGVPTDKVVADVAQLIADLDEWHRKLHANQPKYQADAVRVAHAEATIEINRIEKAMKCAEAALARHTAARATKGGA